MKKKIDEITKVENCKIVDIVDVLAILRCLLKILLIS